MRCDPRKSVGCGGILFRATVDPNREEAALAIGLFIKGRIEP